MHKPSASAPTRPTPSSHPALLAPILGALCVAAVVYLVSAHFIENTVQRVVLRGLFPQDLHVEVLSVSPLGAERSVGFIEITGALQTQSQRSPFLTAPISRLKLIATPRDSQNATLADFNINRIHLEMPYATDYYYTGSVVNEFFDSPEYLVNSRQLYRFNAQRRAVLTATENVGGGNVTLRLFLCLLFFSAFFILFRHIKLDSIPAIHDLTFAPHTNHGREYDAINGVRGLAALLVLFSHTAPHFEAVQMGLALLFVISGFLLSKPFVRQPESIFAYATIEKYLLKRLKRILPMYYAFIFLNFVLVMELDDAVRHFLFVQGDGHLWPMTQIFAFYMLLPFVLLITSACYRVHRLLPLIVLAAVFFAWVNYLLAWTPFFNGRFYNEFYFYAFVTGVFGAYLQYDWIEKSAFFKWSRQTNAHRGASLWALQAFAVIATAVTVLAILWSAPYKLTGVINFWMSQFFVKCVLALAIILLALNGINTWFQRIIANPVFRSVGVVGFSFYLLHGLGITLMQTLQDQYLLSSEPDERTWMLTLGALLITYCLAVCTYSYIERPFFGRSASAGQRTSENP